MPNLFFLYLMEFFAGFSRGAYLVCIGWTTLIITDDVATVGQIFVTAMLSSMLFAPVTGVIVDRYNRKSLTIIAHLGIAISMAAIGTALASDAQMPIIWLFMAVIFISIFRQLYQSCHDGLIQANVAKNQLVHSLAQFRATQLLTVSIGTALTGLIINSFDPASGFMFAAITSLPLIIAATFIKGVLSKENAAGLQGFFIDFVEGLALFRSNASLRTLILIVAIATPVGQLSNAVLSSFMRDDLGFGADAFGFVDAAWPLGGMAAAAILSLGIKKLSVPNMEYILCFAVGLFTIIFSLMSSVISLALVHAALGFTVWMTAIIIDGRVLQTADPKDVGRTKAYIQISYAVIALAMSLSPSVIKFTSSSDYFLYWGVAIVIGALFLSLQKFMTPRPDEL